MHIYTYIVNPWDFLCNARVPNKIRTSASLGKQLDPYVTNTCRDTYIYIIYNIYIYIIYIYIYPEDPCMEYLPTLTPKVI